MKRTSRNEGKILDLDNRATWKSVFLPVLRRREAEEVLRSYRSGCSGEELLEELRVAPEYVRDNAVRELRRVCVALLFSRFTHVIACHGCRVADPADYLSKGLLRSNPDELVARLVQCAPEMKEQIHAAADDLGTDYFEWNRGTVGFLLSQQWAICNRTHYSHGSELIQGIIHRVGPELGRRYVSTGKPSLIRCRIPVEWIRDHSRTGATHEVYATEPFVKLIWANLFPSEGDDAIWTNGGFRLAKDIAPDLIEEVIDMSQTVIDDEWIRELERSPTVNRDDYGVVDGALEINVPNDPRGNRLT